MSLRDRRCPVPSMTVVPEQDYPLVRSGGRRTRTREAVAAVLPRPGSPPLGPILRAPFSGSRAGRPGSVRGNGGDDQASPAIHGDGQLPVVQSEENPRPGGQKVDHQADGLRLVLLPYSSAGCDSRVLRQGALTPV